MLLLFLLLACLSALLPSPALGISKSFVNNALPLERPMFVVNFDAATVICQHSADGEDLHLHDISVLCDGRPDCYASPAMNDENFPHCGECGQGATSPAPPHPLPLQMPAATPAARTTAPACSTGSRHSATVTRASGGPAAS